MLLSKYSLVEKTIKVKFLSSLFNKAKRSFLCFLVEINKNSNLKKNFENFNKSWSVSISNRYLKLLTKEQSLIRWNWLTLWQGSIKIFFTFDYNFNLKNFLNITQRSKDYIILGSFIRSTFFSRKALLWYNTLFLNWNNVKDLRFNSFIKFVYFLQIQKIYLYFYIIHSLKIFFKNLESKILIK